MIILISIFGMISFAAIVANISISIALIIVAGMALGFFRNWVLKKYQSHEEITAFRWNSQMLFAPIILLLGWCVAQIGLNDATTRLIKASKIEEITSGETLMLFTLLYLFSRYFGKCFDFFDKVNSKKLSP